jgi:hypothetical protein
LGRRFCASALKAATVLFEGDWRLVWWRTSNGDWISGQRAMFEIGNFLIAVALALTMFTSSPTMGTGRGSRHLQFLQGRHQRLRRSVHPVPGAAEPSDGFALLRSAMPISECVSFAVRRIPERATGIAGIGRRSRWVSNRW